MGRKWLTLLLGLVLLLSGCGTAGDGSASAGEEAVALVGQPYDYDLGEYLKLRDYTGIRYTPLGDPGRSDVQWGDTVTLELRLDIDGVEEPSTGIDTITVGDSGFLEGFDEGLVGHSVDETVEMELRFPADYGNPDYAGRAVRVTAHILVLDLSVYRDRNENALWDIVVGESQVLQYPEKELLRYEEDYRELYGAFARQYQMSLDDYLQAFFQITEEELPERCRAEAEAAVKEDMVLWAIWRDAGLTLTEEDLENCRQLWLQTYGYQSEDDMPASWEDESIAQSLQRLAVERKVKTLLLQSAVEE